MAEDETWVVADAAPAAIDGVQSGGGRFGAYRLVRMLGKGGMGEVWLAERADDAFSKQVAIKFITGVYGSEAGEWFRRERQTMAKLEHPHIARLLDGGETADGKPFLVMEYVEGVPIDEWCEGKPLQRVLDLFLQVCSALEHAHRALIVHRDIKPANVIVTAEGESRLLDFGIAKQVATTAEERAEQTTTQAYTLHYASPEQMEGGDITVVSDIYSLGALLYRLLSGRVPHADTNSALGQLQAIHTTQPKRPSQVVLENARIAMAERRRRARRLHGDLDDIVLKCLRLEPELRYGSARELIDDIGRYRSHQPVLARKGSASYRATRFVRRHWLALSAAAAVLLSLAGGLYATYLQKQEAERQSALAQKRFDLSRSLVNDVMFNFQDRLGEIPGTIPARRELMQRTEEYLTKIAVDAQDDPGLLADLALAEGRLGDVAGNPQSPNVGDTAGAARHYQRAVDFGRRAMHLQPDHPEASRGLGRALHAQANFYFWGNDLQKAEKLYMEEIPLQELRLRRAPGRGTQRDLGAALMGLADVYFWQSKLDLALKTYDRACSHTIAGNSKGAALPDATALDDLAVCHSRRADTLAWLERYDEAEDLAGKAVAIYDPMFRADPANIHVGNAYSIALNKQGEIFVWQKKFEQAFAAYSKSLEIAEHMYKADPADLRSARSAAMARNKRGDAYMETKRYKESIADYLVARAMFEVLRKRDPGNAEHERDLAICNHRIGVATVLGGDAAAAAPYFEAEVAIMRKRWQAAPREAWSRRDLAVALQDLMQLPVSTDQLCSWFRENRDLLRSLKADGVAAPTDLEQLATAEKAVALCPAPLPAG